MQSSRDKKESKLDKAVALVLNATDEYLEASTPLYKKIFSKKGIERAKKIKTVLTHPQMQEDDLSKVVVLLAIFSEKNSSEQLLSLIANQWIVGEYLIYSYTPKQNENTLHSDIFARTLLNEAKNSCMQANSSISLCFDKKKAALFLLEKTFRKSYENKSALVKQYVSKLHDYFENAKEEKLSSLFFLSDPRYAVARTAGAITGLFQNLPPELSTHISFFLTDKDTRFAKRTCKSANARAKEIETQAINGDLHFSRK